MTDYRNVSAILLGGRWIQVSEGTEACGGEISFRTAPYTRLIVRQSAIDAVKVVDRPEITRPAINTPWEQN